jgi:molecular chaperone DnaK
MARKTIDFGIDLGTTNSVIACMDRGQLVIIRDQVNLSEVTPSAVKMDARGSVTVGQNAYNELESDSDNAVGEFKRWMGNPEHDSFTFKDAGKRMTAAELSAEVLKVLKGSAATRFGGEELTAAVITVPAHFLIPACEDTTNAAKLAGIEICTLIQEPVAAAMAYGYQSGGLSGNLLVFDLGGGTFDTSLLSARDGRLVVIGHDGDAKLGGKDFDWALVEVIVGRIREEYGDISLCRSNAAAKRAMAKLKFLAENAKKALSAFPKTSFEVKRLDPPFEKINTTIELTRVDLERATEYFTAKCISISKRLLKESGLSRESLASVLVVGGQTQTPYLRDAVLSEFGKAECRLDPLTVVAAGAALYASTQRMPARPKVATVSGSAVSLKIAYRAVSSDPDADIGLAIAPAPPGTTVTIVRMDGGWSSGAIPVPGTGNLFTTVVLRLNVVNSFEVQLKDAKGARIRADESSFTITQGLNIAGATTSRTVAIALADNLAEVMIRKGSPLPAKVCRKFSTAHDVIAGNPNSILRTYVLEGENSRSDRNIAIGTIELHGSDLRRTLPAGEEVEIRYQLDESRNLSAEAFFPNVNETCVMVRIPSLPSLLPAEIDLELTKEKDRLESIKRAAPEKVDPMIEKEILLIEREKRAAAEDPDAKQKAPQQLLELKPAIDAMEKVCEWDLLITDLKDFRGPARKLSQASGSKEQARDVEESIQAAENAVSRRDLGALRSATEELQNVYWAINCARDDFWKERFGWWEKQTDFSDLLEADRLKGEGSRALARNDIRSLRTIVRNLYALSPFGQKSKFDGRFEAGIVGNAKALEASGFF